MNAIDPSLSAVAGRVDADGRLTAADPRLLDLVERAGGGIGADLALPALAGVARLARRLGIAIVRSVTVADGDDDLDLWVRAEPDGDAIALEVGGWASRAAWASQGDEAARAADFVVAGADLRWEVDAALRLTHVAAARGGAVDADAGLLGQPLVSLFALGEGGDGAFPILAAVAGAAGFDGQAATVRASGQRVTLSAAVRVDERGRFAGFSGAAHAVVDADPAPPAQGFPAGFGERLDRALRTPLERIVANASSMSAGVEGPIATSYAGYADDIASAGRHLLGLVTDLVDLEAVERDDFAIAPEPIDLADVARRAAGLLSVRAGERDVRIDRPDVRDTLPATGEFRRALQVLVNLIANAVRYSPAGGMIWVRAERDGARVCVIVADQGKGVAIEDQAMIFEKFGRVDPGEAGGSGLGLYISRRLARAMGGDIVVDSAAGQGARFIFSLPAR